MNVILGANAQGKTSLLEAILFTATSKSHRTGNEEELAAHGGDWFRLSAKAARVDREVSVDAFWHRGVKRFKVNGVAQTRISDILGKLAVVLFSPEDLALVKGSAALRRRFLDMELSQVSPVYLAALQRYRQALRQRNELLKGIAPDGELLDAWDAQLAEQGAVLMRERDAFVRGLGDAAAGAYDRIAGGESLSLVYQPDLPDESGIAAALAKSRPTDIRRQFTQRGPHRDDVEILVAGRPARTFASQGQQKSAALAVKLAELDWVRERMGEYPVFMLDEVLSELDASRARRLVEAVNPAVQWLLTTTDAVRPGVFDGLDFKRFEVANGEITEA